MKTPERGLRDLLKARIAGSRRAGPGKTYAIGEMAELVEFELKKQNGSRTTRQLAWTIGLLRRATDAVLAAIVIEPRPAAFETLKSVLDESEAVRVLLEFQADMQKVGCLVMLPAGSPDRSCAAAFGVRDDGYHHNYFQALRDGAPLSYGGCPATDALSRRPRARAAQAHARVARPAEGRSAGRRADYDRHHQRSLRGVL